MDHKRFDDLKEAYAFGALSDEERLEFEEYLAAHPELQAEVDDLGATVNLLALAPEEYEPSPELRNRILGAIGAEVPEVTRIEATRSRRLLKARNLAAAAATALLIALASWNVVLLEDLRETRSELAERQEPRVIRLQGSGEAESARVELMRTDDGMTVLTAEDLPEIPEGRTYQVWLIEGDRPEPAGLLEPGPDATAAAVVGGSIEDANTIAVTVEPDGGSDAPTTQPVLSANL
jgi:anti-sigma-K factor RskA